MIFDITSLVKESDRIRPSFRHRSREFAMVTDFWRELAKIDIPHVHSVSWHSTMHGSVAP